MKQKRIVLLVDNNWRDIAGICFVAGWLIKKFNHFPILISTQQELPSLIKYKPDMLVINHLRYARFKDWLEYAKRQHTAIAVLPTEGTPWNRIPAMLGQREYYKYLDLLLSWNKGFVDQYKTEKNVRTDAVFTIVGCPRFDPLAKSNAMLNLSREDFAKKYSVDPDKPVILWFSNTPFAHGEKVSFENNRSAVGFERLRGPEGEKDWEKFYEDSEKAYRGMMEAFIKYVKEFPGYNYIVKPHPGEDVEKYYIEPLKGFKNVRIVGRNELSTGLIPHADIQLGYRCTTLIESWLNDLYKPTITLELQTLHSSYDRNKEGLEFKEIIDGNIVATSADELRDQLNFYLNGGKITDKFVLESRKRALQEFVNDVRGNSAEKCADAINEYLLSRGGPKRSLYNYNIMTKRIKRLSRYGTWQHAVRSPEHEHYLHKDHIKTHMDRFNECFHAGIKSDDYDIYT